MNAPQKTAVVGAFEAKTKFSALLDRVEAGEEITITRNGKAVAHLTRETRRSSPEEIEAVIERMRELRRGNKLAPGETIKDLIHEGRKY